MKIFLQSSPTPLIPISKLSPFKNDPVIMPASDHNHPTLMPLTSNNYISEAFLRSAPSATKPLTSNGYVTHDAVARVYTLRHSCYADHFEKLIIIFCSACYRLYILECSYKSTICSAC